MNYFKSTELAKMQHVDERTVRNWVRAAKEGKLDLDLYRHKDRTYVSNTTGNLATIAKLVEERRKFRPLSAVKSIAPEARFYELFSESQIHDIVNDLETHRELPRQYSYFDGGAEYWDEYAERMATEDTPNLLNSTVKLLGVNQDYIDDLLAAYKRVNVVDVGVGNAYPVRGLLAHLLEQGKLGRYIALDISPRMLEIARSNIHRWFGDKVPFEGYEHDVNYNRFSKLVADESTQDGADEVVNVVLLLGGTLSNMRSADSGLRMIHDSMRVNDILIHSTKLDTEHTRRFFDFNLPPGENNLAPVHRLAVDLLGIKPSYYEVERGFDSSRSQRFERIRLTVALTITFRFSTGRRIVNLNKDDCILVWRGLQQSADDVKTQFARNELCLLHTSQTRDQEYILTVSCVEP